jgi:hypothetical protein|nr:hypothetical protein [Kofleriaceae bacterium]
MRLLYLAAISVVSINCGGDDCGPHGASAIGLFVQNGALKMTFGGLQASPNQDCPDPNAPAGVVPLTIEGVQTDGSGAVTFCIPRPDKLTSDSVLGDDTPSSPMVHIVDLTGFGSDGCVYSFDQNTPPTGSMKAAGICDNGASASGFALTVDGDVPMTGSAGDGGSNVACNITNDESFMLVGTVQVVRGNF